MIIHLCDQYTPEWWAARRGLPTASSGSKIITAKKGDLSTQAIGLRNMLIADRMGHGDQSDYKSEWMERGRELESEARSAFAFLRDVDPLQVGFITNEEKTAGASPDALLPARSDWTFDDDSNVVQIAANMFDAGLEIKCPKPSTQIGRLLNPVLPDSYKSQVHWSMAVSNIRKWWFMSYHPDFDPVIVLVEWNEYTDAVANAIAKFAAMMNDAETKLAA